MQTADIGSRFTRRSRWASTGRARFERPSCRRRFSVICSPLRAAVRCRNAQVAGRRWFRISAWRGCPRYVVARRSSPRNSSAAGGGHPEQPIATASAARRYQGLNCMTGRAVSSLPDRLRIVHRKPHEMASPPGPFVLCSVSAPSRIVSWTGGCASHSQRMNSHHRDSVRAI